jgi:hypothetical protein
MRRITETNFKSAISFLEDRNVARNFPVDNHLGLHFEVFISYPGRNTLQSTEVSLCFLHSLDANARIVSREKYHLILSKLLSVSSIIMPFMEAYVLGIDDILQHHQQTQILSFSPLIIDWNTPRCTVSSDFAVQWVGDLLHGANGRASKYYRKWGNLAVDLVYFPLLTCLVLDSVSNQPTARKNSQICAERDLVNGKGSQENFSSSAIFPFPSCISTSICTIYLTIYLSIYLFLFFLSLFLSFCY